MAGKRVFVAHGRDLLARDAVRHLLETVGLEPVFLAETVAGGHTWLEGLEQVSATADAAVVILRGDDLGALRSEPSRRAVRARQNVVLELGLMIGKLGRGKVIVLLEEGVDVPSNYHGARVVNLKGEWDWKMDLCAMLQAAGLAPDQAQLLRPESRTVPGDQQIILTSTERTRLIVKDLDALARNPGRREVRFAGFLSPFAIGDGELAERIDDGQLLREERDAMLSLARNGAAISCIVTPPLFGSQGPDRLRTAQQRVETLLRFLRGEGQKLTTIKWAIAPHIENYVYVVGDLAFYQGFKGQATLRGFGITEKRTERSELARQSHVFDERLKIHENATLSQFGAGHDAGRMDGLRLALANALEESLKVLQRQAVP